MIGPDQERYGTVSIEMDIDLPIDGAEKYPDYSSYLASEHPDKVDDFFKAMYRAMEKAAKAVEE